MDDRFAATYKAGAAVCGFFIFIGSWIYCIANYGFLLGVGLGWLPALITAFVLCWFWPLYVLGALALVWMIITGR